MDLDNQPQGPSFDDEAAMAKADLYKLGKYSIKLFKMMHDGQELEGWVQAKITKAADYIASVYHYMEYEMKQSEYGDSLDMADLYSESLQRALQQRLMEAKAAKEPTAKQKKESAELKKKSENNKKALSKVSNAYAKKSKDSKSTGDEFEVDEGAGTTLRMKAKNRVYRGNDAIKKNNADANKSNVSSLSKSDIKGYTDDLVGMVNKTGKTITSKAAQKGKLSDKDESKVKSKNKSDEAIQEIKMVGNTPWKEVDPQVIAKLIEKFFASRGKNVATVDVARWLHHNHKIGVGDVDGVRRNLDRMLAKKEFHYLNPQRMFGLRDRY